MEKTTTSKKNFTERNTPIFPHCRKKRVCMFPHMHIILTFPYSQMKKERACNAELQRGWDFWTVCCAPFTFEHATAKHVKNGRPHDMAKLLQALCHMIFKGNKH
jgi:hypothetical protein